MVNILLEDSWKNHLLKEFDKDYMKNLKLFLQEQKRIGKTIYPRGSEYFNALNLIAFDKVQVVLLGQDPYHGIGQAHGLSFSVKHNIPIPPSLRNIYKELSTDLGIKEAKHGCLEHWAKEGVLLLNSILTVESERAGSHRGKGWEEFTDKIISLLSREKSNLVFILWGNFAKSKKNIIDEMRHKVIESVHPSPLSAHRGFFQSKPFSATNKYLIEHNGESINWQLPNIANS